MEEGRFSPSLFLSNDNVLRVRITHEMSAGERDASVRPLFSSLLPQTFCEPVIGIASVIIMAPGLLPFFSLPPLLRAGESAPGRNRRKGTTCSSTGSGFFFFPLLSPLPQAGDFLLRGEERRGK